MAAPSKMSSKALSFTPGVTSPGGWTWKIKPYLVSVSDITNQSVVAMKQARPYASSSTVQMGWRGASCRPSRSRSSSMETTFTTLKSFHLLPKHASNLRISGSLLFKRLNWKRLWCRIQKLWMWRKSRWMVPRTLRLWARSSRCGIGPASFSAVLRLRLLPNKKCNKSKRRRDKIWNYSKVVR